MNSEKLNQLYLARKNVIKMIEARGFVVDNTMKSMTKERLSVMYQIFLDQPSNKNWVKKSDILDIVVENEDCKAVVVWLPDDYSFQKVNNYLKKLVVNQYEFTENDDLIVVLLDNKILDFSYYQLESDNITLFSLANFQFNLIDHQLIPTHRPLGDKESKHFLKKLSLKKENLPLIHRFYMGIEDKSFSTQELRGDPVARYYGVRLGTIIEITRNSQASGPHRFYRLVSGNPPIRGINFSELHSEIEDPSMTLVSELS